MSKTMTTATNDASTRIDAYIDAASEEMRDPLRQMRRAIQDAAQDAVEAFGYGLPGFKYLGRPLLYFGATKKHYALYGNTESAATALKEDLKDLDISKGTIRFNPDRPFPEALIRKLTEVRLAEIQAAEAERKEKARARRNAKA
jgi:uncharacterized protein YdhG (YjbR/CyaY superfamily)